MKATRLSKIEGSGKAWFGPLSPGGDLWARPHPHEGGVGVPIVHLPGRGPSWSEETRSKERAGVTAVGSVLLVPSRLKLGSACKAGITSSVSWFPPHGTSQARSQHGIGLRAVGEVHFFRGYLFGTYPGPATTVVLFCFVSS